MSNLRIKEILGREECIEDTAQRIMDSLVENRDDIGLTKLFWCAGHALIDGSYWEDPDSFLRPPLPDDLERLERNLSRVWEYVISPDNPYPDPMDMSDWDTATRTVV